MRRLIGYVFITMVFIIGTLTTKISLGENLKDEPIDLDLNTFMPVEEVKPGMKGIGKTVFSGTRIDEFQVEIVGVLKNITPRGDMILARVTGGPLPLERTGVIAGMSGSPIYINGRLVGALAYTLSIFQTEPMAGITPILEMIAEYERNKADLEGNRGQILKADRKEESCVNKSCASTPRDTASLPTSMLGSRIKMFNFWNSVMNPWAQEWNLSSRLGTFEASLEDLDVEIQKLKEWFALRNPGFSWPIDNNRQTQDSEPWRFSFQTSGPPVSGLPSSFIPIKTPLTLSGIDERVLKEITPLLESYGIVPVQGGEVAGLSGSIQETLTQNSSASASSAVEMLRPGSSLGVQLIRGDLTASGFGTVTYVNKNHLIAFGHPMFAAGKVDIPMTTSYVHMVMANQINSFKIASPLTVMGSIRQDRRTGITGVMGSPPQMVPLKVVVESEKDHRVNEYNFEIINDDFFAPLFVRISCLNSLFASFRAIGDVTIKVQSEVYLKDRPPLIQKNVFSGDEASVLASLASVRPVGILMNNPFEDVQVEKILIHLSVSEKLEVAKIEGARVSRDVVKPGESTRLTVFIQPFHGELIAEKVDVTIPESSPRGEYRLMVCDSQIINTFEKFRAPLNFEPQSLTQLMSLLETEEQNNEIIVQLIHPKSGVTIKGREFSSPPVSLLAIMNSSRHVGEGGPTRGTIFTRQRIPTNYMISGCELLPITVDDKYGIDLNTDGSPKIKKGDNL
ncbi:MAG TPA: SpoIVB peptidase S55 domain-containing protein [Candidatus Limnocylindrales bacterium]|nr:SpoIVB peptidase S55 domain-containing protein [Candidatus Limnocylindrales bacterium]